MSAATAPGFGILLRETRKREGLSQTQLAGYLGTSKSKVSKLESGSNKPPADPAFYDRLEKIRGFTVVDIARLQVVAAYDRSLAHGKKPQYHIYSKFIAHVRVVMVLRQLVPDKVKVQVALTHLLRYDISFLPYGISSHVRIAAQEVLHVLKHVEILPYPHRMPEHGSRIVEEGNWQEATVKRRTKIVYERPRSHYDSVYLRENADNVSRLLSTVLKTDDPALSTEYKQALHVIVESVVKTKGTSLSKVSQEYNIPHPSLIGWVRKGLIPILYKDKGTIYLAKETAQELSHDYKDARKMGYAAARLLRERREKYFPEETSTSEVHERDRTPVLRASEEGSAQAVETSTSEVHERDRTPQIRTPEQGSAQAYEVVATLSQAAQLIGVAPEELMTLQDIKAEWNIDPGRIHEWTRRGRQGQPHLTPLPVRLRGERGSNQRLFRREDVARVVAAPPKPGAPRKHSRLPSPP
jgi:transcriptional regulator with XRE-family HTH domain